MLVDISNSVQATPAPSSPGSAALVEGAGSKRPWQAGQDDLLPNKLKAKRGLGSSSSPVAAGRSSSPFGFTNSRLAPYDAPTSPSFSKLSTSPAANNFSSLPPSSPSFARSVDLLTSVAAEEPAVEDDDGDDAEPLVLRLERGTMMQFGRKAKQRAVPCPETTLPIALPKSAKNASRLHCTVKIKPSTSKLVVEIRVLGQNGMKIDGKLWRAGSVAVLPLEAGAKLDLDFWGWSSVIIVAESERKDKRERTISARAPTIRMSSPASSACFFDDTGDLSLPEDLLPAASSSSSALAIPASPTPSDHSALSELSSPAHPSAALPESRAETLLGTLGLDLAGLVASQIVFSPRSTVGVEEVIKGLLREVGGMWDVLDDGKGSEDQSEEREDHAVEEWWDVVECVLREEPFFGCIDNAGLKDAAGHPLLPVYFYVPDADPSASRVEALEPFVKRVRGARTSKPVRYFWAKPSLRKNR